jgi:outer membrane receptor for ferrienterochelin and colicins
MKMKKTFSLFLIFLAPSLCLPAEKGSIEGQVIELPANKPLIGANIQINGTTLGASSDINGHFLIPNVPVSKYTIRATMIGYRAAVLKNVQVLPNEKTSIEFKLHESAVNFDPTVVTANKAAQQLDETANQISVVSSQEIRQRMPLRVDQVLEAVPGVNFIRDQINIRGSTGFTIGAANRTLLLIDGIPVMTSDTGQFNWDLLPVLDIDQIEVVKGAGSALWGTSALGGVINIITKQPTEIGKTMFRFTIGQYDKILYPKWRWTSNALRFGRLDASYGRKIGSWGLRFSAGRQLSDGYTENGDYTRWNMTGKVTYFFNNGSSWVLYSAFNQNLEGFYIGWDDPVHPYEMKSANVSRGQIRMSDVYTKFNWIITPKVALNFRISYLMSLMGTQVIQSADFNPGHGLGAEVQGTILPSPKMDITYGCEFKWDTGNTKYFGDHQGYTIGLYSQVEYRLLQNLKITPGVRYDRYQLIDGLSQSLTSPRFGINYKPNEKTVLRASAGTGFRAATIAERYLDFKNRSVSVEANPNLKAESARSFDIGWRQYLTTNWYIELGAFQNNFNNLIEIDLKQSQIEFAKDIRVSVRFQNLIKARIQGLELGTAGNWWHNRIRLQASATFMDHKNISTNLPLTYRPKIIAFINPAIKLGDWEFQTDFQYASRIEAVKLFQYDERIPQKVWNFRLSYHLYKTELQFAVNNALDYYYTQIERSMAPNRNFTFSIIGEF